MSLGIFFLSQPSSVICNFVNKYNKAICDICDVFIQYLLHCTEIYLQPLTGAEDTPTQIKKKMFSKRTQKTLGGGGGGGVVAALFTSLFTSLWIMENLFSCRLYFWLCVCK